MVQTSRISEETWEAWEWLSGAEGWADISSYRNWMPIEVAAPFWFFLRQVPDSGEHFPKGKWASLGVFEKLIDQAASEQVSQKKEENPK